VKKILIKSLALFRQARFFSFVRQFAPAPIIPVFEAKRELTGNQLL